MTQNSEVRVKNVAIVVFQYFAVTLVEILVARKALSQGDVQKNSSKQCR
jgi:hypothetical protein